MKDEFVEIEPLSTNSILPIHPPLLFQQNAATEKKKKKPRKERQRKSYTLQKKLECLGNSDFFLNFRVLKAPVNCSTAKFNC